MNQFKERTDKMNRKYLNNLKTDLGLALVEKQLQKNELLNDITEDILDLKGDLMNKLNRLEMKQKAEIKTLAYCLQNSGDDKVESLTTRLFGEDVLKPEEEILNFSSGINSMNTTGLKFTGSVFNTNLFRTNVPKKEGKRASIDEGNRLKRASIDEGNRLKRASIDEGNRIKRASIDEGNRLKRKSTMLNSTQDVIIEEDKEDENKD